MNVWRTLTTQKQGSCWPNMCTHTETHDNRTWSGPRQLSDNLQYFNCPQPIPELWADLYSTWNLAFTAGFPDFVYYMPKLLIPSVGAYQNDTGSYIYPRMFVLIIH